MLGADKALQFFAGYVVELSLSVDNLFVFLLLFKFFQVNLSISTLGIKHPTAKVVVHKVTNSGVCPVVHQDAQVLNPPLFHRFRVQHVQRLSWGLLSNRCSTGESKRPYLRHIR